MRTRLALPVAALALLAGHGARPASATPLDASMSTAESGCSELNVSRLADPAAVTALLPDGWRPALLANGRAPVFFVDYVCEGLSVDGRPGRRSIVSMGVAQNATRTDGTAGRRSWVLWHGTDNPHLVERLRSLGVESRYVPRSTADVAPTDDGRVRVALSYVDDRPGPGLGYEFATVAPEPAAALTGQGGIFSFAGTHGVVTMDFRNSARSVRGGTGLQAFAADSVPRSLGIADLPPTTSTAFQLVRGSWTSTITLTP